MHPPPPPPPPSQQTKHAHTHKQTQDIDGFDLALARAVLEAGYRPKVVLMEINSDVAAPFVFETQFREDWSLYFG